LIRDIRGKKLLGCGFPAFAFLWLTPSVSGPRPSSVLCAPNRMPGLRFAFVEIVRAFRRVSKFCGSSSG
jgi:hypothetical protein